MHGQYFKDISKFFVAGINYKKTNASVRGSFAINNEQYAELLSLAPSYGIQELFVLSTCNRTEIYGFAEHADQLVHLLCTQTEGNIDTFKKLSYIKKGSQAIDHLLSVAAGLDSQILGDYEIVGQIKQAVKFAWEHNHIDAFMERLVNCVLQSSKAIKNQTALSGGTVSVSFAAVQYIKEKMGSVAGKKILLLGIGKIGRNTCKNLVDYLDATHITLINRTEEKAAALAGELGLHHAAYEDLTTHIQQADIILVATNSAKPVVHTAQLANMGQKLIIDLSIPYNVEPAARQLPDIQLVNVDDLSKLKDETLQKRQEEVPRALEIIEEHRTEFVEWVNMRRHVPILKAVKSKLQEIQTFPLYSQLTLADSCPADTQQKIQRVINGMASKMRVHNQGGCNYIEAINEFIARGTN